MRRSHDRMLALALAGLVFILLWLGAGQAYLKRRPAELRLLPVEEGFALASAGESSYAAAAPQPALPQRRTIALERPERSQTDVLVSRRSPSIGRHLQAAPGEETAASSARRALQARPLLNRNSGGLALEAEGPVEGTPEQSAADRPAMRAPTVARRETQGQRVAGPAPRPHPAQPVAMDQITRWMRLQPAELPPGIRRHVGYQPENLTATADWVQGGKVYEIYMLVRVPLRELHVVMVSGDETWYLVDRSFERQGRKFRAGNARREGGVITGVVSEERPAASIEATAFYKIFLTWWDQERLKLP